MEMGWELELHNSEWEWEGMGIDCVRMVEWRNGNVESHFRPSLVPISQ